jgi:hypothetical protein
MKTLMPSRVALRDVRIFQSVYGYTSGWRVLHARYLADGELPTIPPRWARPTPPSVSDSPKPEPARTTTTVRALAAARGVRIFKIIAAGAPIGLHLHPESHLSPGVAAWLAERVADGRWATSSNAVAPSSRQR